jgi:Rrf2 family protein
MKISTRVRYGLRFMLELAGHYQKGPVFLRDIARSQEISEKYLGQIAIDLKLAHLIDGFRGAHGGYVLTKPPSEIRVYDIVVVFEGDLALVECARDPSLCNRASHCIAHEVWHKLGQVMTETLEAITLADLLERQREKMQESGMYHI